MPAEPRLRLDFGRRGETRARGLREVPAANAEWSRCTRWPKKMRLAACDGRLVPGRCRATNLCAYCRTMYLNETVEALTLDALGGDAPGVYAVLTCREHLTRAEFNEHLRLIRKKLARKKWGGWRWEYFAEVEFQRRGALHVNLLIKGVPRERVDEFRIALLLAWGERVTVAEDAQYCEVMADAIAVAKYTSKMLAHGLKREQAPPLGWKGHRTSHTRGYFGRPMWKVRREAHESLQRSRELHKALGEGLQPAEAQTVADARALRASGESWELVVVDVTEAGELRRVRPAVGNGGTVTAMRSDEARRRRFAAEEDAGRALRALAEVAGRDAEDATSGVGAAAEPPLF